MEHSITITFNREKKTHDIDVKDVSGMEMLMAYQTLGKAIEDKLGLPAEVALAMAYSNQEQEKEESDD